MLGSFVPIIDDKIREMQKRQLGRPPKSQVIAVDYVIDMLLDMRAMADAVHSNASPDEPVEIGR